MMQTWATAARWAALSITFLSSPVVHGVDPGRAALGFLQLAEATAAVEEDEPEPPVIKAGRDGFSIESGDGSFALRLRAFVQADGRFYFGNDQTGPAGGLVTATGSDDFLLRRARIDLTGKLFERFDFKLMPDFAPAQSTVFDAWLRFTLRPSLQFVAGKMKPLIGLEREQHREFNLFNELAYPTALVPIRDIGFVVQGDVADGRFHYYVGAFNGSADFALSTNDTDDGKTAGARVFVTPTEGALRGLGVGLAATDGEQEGVPSPYRTMGLQIFWQPRTGVATDGEVQRLAAQGYYFRGPFGLMSEYATSRHEVRFATAFDQLEHVAWHLTATWVLTGEDATFHGTRPDHDVDPESGAWGAWQLVARVTELDVDDDSFPVFADPAASSSEARTLGIGVHWIMNPQIRLTVDYNATDLEGGSLGEDGEDVVIARVQLRF